MRTFYTAAFLILFISTCFSQEVDVKHYDKDGNATEKDKSYYTEIGIKVNSYAQIPGERLLIGGYFIDTVMTFYSQNDKIRSWRTYDKNGKLQGRYEGFYANGIRKEAGTYLDNRNVGKVYHWYESGKPHFTSEYVGETKPESFDSKGTNLSAPIDVTAVSVERGSTRKPRSFSERPSEKTPSNQLRPNQSKPFDYKIIDYWTPLGIHVVNNGNGVCLCSFEDESIIEKGHIVDGWRDSLWTGHRNDSLLFSERYSQGKLESGERHNGSAVVTYEFIDEPPSYVGGLSAMGSYLGKTMRYPADARRMGIEGKVFVGFSVQKNGTISDSYLVKGIHPSINNEALRTVSLMPAWNPGKLRGVPVMVRYIIPINFSLE